jgi:hypothetical protein
MKVETLARQFPPDDIRYSPVPEGTNDILDQRLNQEPEIVSLFRGPLVLELFDPQHLRFGVGALSVQRHSTLRTAVIWGVNLIADDDRPFVIPPAFIGNPRDDGSVVVVTKGEWTFPSGAVLKLRPLLVEDGEWLGASYDTLDPLAYALVSGELCR